MTPKQTRKLIVLLTRNPKDPEMTLLRANIRWGRNFRTGVVHFYRPKTRKHPWCFVEFNPDDGTYTFIFKKSKTGVEIKRLSNIRGTELYQIFCENMGLTTFGHSDIVWDEIKYNSTTTTKKA